MVWDEPGKSAKDIVEAIEKFSQSSSELSKKMFTLSGRIYFLNWIMVILVAVMVGFMAWTIWLTFGTKAWGGMIG